MSLELIAALGLTGLILLLGSGAYWVMDRIAERAHGRRVPDHVPDDWQGLVLLADCPACERRGVSHTVVPCGAAFCDACGHTIRPSVDGGRP